MRGGELQNTMFYLVGFAGVGKYTLAKELAALTGARIVDNHYINNPVFSLIEQDGVTPLPDEVWKRTMQIRDGVFETIATLSPRDWNFVFTQVLVEGDAPLAIATYYLLLDVAAQRSSLFIPVRLVCQTDELCRRVVTPKRRERMKSVDATVARRQSETLEVYRPDHPNTLTLDVTDHAPRRAAERIVQHAQTCESALSA